MARGQPFSARGRYLGTRPVCRACPPGPCCCLSRKCLLFLGADAVGVCLLPTPHSLRLQTSFISGWSTFCTSARCGCLLDAAALWVCSSSGAELVVRLDVDHVRDDRGLLVCQGLAARLSVPRVVQTTQQVARGPATPSCDMDSAAIQRNRRRTVDPSLPPSPYVTQRWRVNPCMERSTTVRTGCATLRQHLSSATP